MDFRLEQFLFAICHCIKVSQTWSLDCIQYLDCPLVLWPKAEPFWQLLSEQVGSLALAQSSAGRVLFLAGWDPKFGSNDMMCHWMKLETKIMLLASALHLHFYPTLKKHVCRALSFMSLKLYVFALTRSTCFASKSHECLNAIPFAWGWLSLTLRVFSRAKNRGSKGSKGGRTFGSRNLEKMIEALL